MFPLLLLSINGCSAPPDGESSQDDPAGDTGPVDEDTGGGSDSGGGEDTGPMPEEYEYPGEDDPPAEWDEDAAALAVQAVLDDLRDHHATPVLGAYSRAMTSASGECPQRTVNGADERWIARCSTGAGASFDGYAQVDAYTDQNESGTVWDGWFYYLAAIVETTDGYTLEGGGSMRLQEGEGYDGQSSFRAWYTFLQGTIRWDGPGSAGTWLEDEVTPNLGMNARFYPDTGAHALTVDGALSLPGDTLTALTFRDVRITRDERGAECEVEPKGEMALRDGSGTWYEIMFDTADGMNPADCDGCGTVRRNGEQVGRLCLDFTALTDWTGAPW